jgi:hypothetical protein
VFILFSLTTQLLWDDSKSKSMTREERSESSFLMMEHLLHEPFQDERQQQLMAQVVPMCQWFYSIRLQHAEIPARSKNSH